jgi:hypothetical protein
MATLPNGIAPVGSAPKGVLTPELAQQQAQIQRRLAIAQMLQQEGMSPDEHPEWNAMRIIPRESIAPGLAKLAQVLAGNKIAGDVQGQQADLARTQYAAQRSAIGSLPGVSGGAPGDVSAPQGGGVSPAQAVATVNKVTNPNNPNGLTVDQALYLQQNSPEAWNKYIESQLVPTDEVRTATAEGRNLTQMGQLADAKDRASGVINVAPNSTAFIPGVSTPVVGADFTNGRAGGYTPQGQPVLNAIQGADVIAQQAGQTKAAQESNTILPSVTMADGSVRPMWAGQAAGGGGSAPPAQTGNMSDFADQKRQQMDAINQRAAELVNGGYMTPDQGDKYVKDQYVKNGLNPDENASSAPDPGKLPGPVPTINAASGVGQSTMDKSLTESRAKAVGDFETQVNEDAATALTKKASNVKMQQMLPDVTTGPLASKITFVRNIADSLGVTGIKAPDTNQEFEKYAIQNALAAAKQIYGARLTNQDVQTQLNSSPGTNLTEKANNYLISLDNIKQDRLIQRQQVYNAYKQAPNADLTQFQPWFNRYYPDQGIAASVDLSPGAKAPVSDQPEVAPAPAKVLKYDPVTHSLKEG